MKSRFTCLVRAMSFLIFVMMVGHANAALPTLTLTRMPNPMMAGKEYTVTWKTTNANSISYNCTANGSGFSGSGVLNTVNGSSAGIASLSWVNYPSNCAWKVTGPGGTVNIGETFTTRAKAPTISVSRSPNPLISGKGYTISWTSTDATSVSYNCTSSGSGFAGTGTLASVNGSTQGIAVPGWVGNSSNCIWVATGPGGVQTFPETLTTVKDPTNQGDIVGRDLLVTGLGWVGHVGIWDGTQVIETLNDIADVIQVNDLGSFKLKSVYWGAASPKISPYLVDNCFERHCTKFWPIASGGQIETIPVRTAIVRRAFQIKAIGADYTTSVSYKSAWAGDANHGSEKGRYRCDTFIEDLFASTMPYGNVLMANKPFDREWGNKVVTMRDRFSPILPLTLFNYYK
jgi:hypothetical protein